MVIQRLAREAAFNKLVKMETPTIAPPIAFVAELNALATSKFWTHVPEFRLYPEIQTAHIEPLEFAHLWQLEETQLRIVSLISLWIGLDTPLTSELM